MRAVLNALLLIALLATATSAGRTRNEEDAAHPSKDVALHGHNIPTPGAQEDAIRGMSTRQLRRFLKDRGASCSGCVEKTNLVERAITVKGWATADDLVAADLTPSIHSASVNLALHQITTPPADMPRGSVAVLHSELPQPNGDVIIGDEICNPRLLNGTQFCHSIHGMQKHARAAMS